jgi:hypothetical protein
MTKLFLGLVLSLTLSPSISKPVKNPSATVYICDSSTSIAYHSDKNCKGLNRCTHTIVSVSEDDAVKKYKKRRCKICY